MSKFTQALKKIQTVLHAPDAPDSETAPSLETRLSKPFEPRKSPERRRSERTSCIVQARAIVNLSDQDCWITQGQIVNISSQGLLFEVHNQNPEDNPLMRKGNSIHVSLVLNPETKESLDIEGQVIRNFHKKRALLGVSTNEETANRFASAHAALLQQIA